MSSDTLYCVPSTRQTVIAEAFDDGHAFALIYLEVTCIAIGRIRQHKKLAAPFCGLVLHLPPWNDTAFGFYQPFFYGNDLVWVVVFLLH